MTKQFNNMTMRRMYDFMWENGDPSQRGSGSTAAFWRGYHRVLTQANTYPRDTLAYAAWAAGRDRRKADDKAKSLSL
jgi:hypothetical protein